MADETVASPQYFIVGDAYEVVEPFHALLPDWKNHILLPTGEKFLVKEVKNKYDDQDPHEWTHIVIWGKSYYTNRCFQLGFCRPLYET